MKKRLIINTIGLTALGALLVPAMVSCDKKAESTQTSGIATIACDATFENILSQEIDVFEYIYPDASVIPYYVDQHAALDSLLSMKTKMAVLTRPLNEKELAYLKSEKKIVHQTQIAVDALALIVNPENPTEIMDKKELTDILTGKITKWSDVVVDKGKLGDIAVVFDHQGSSTVQYMRDSLMNGAEFGPNIYAQKNPEDVFKAVANNKNAIGIIGVSWITSDMRSQAMTREEMVKAVDNPANDSTSEASFNNAIKVLKVRGNNEVTAYKPYQYYIYEGLYPLYRQIYLVSTGAPGTISHGFYSFVTGFKGQKIMLMTGVLPKVVHPRMVEITN